MLLHHIKHNQVLHEQVVLFSVITEPAPWVRPKNGLEVRDLGHGFFRVVARVGFMQTPNVPELLGRCEQRGIRTNPMTTTYYLGRETLLTTGTTKMARGRKLLFSFLSRNARPPTASSACRPTASSSWARRSSCDRRQRRDFFWRRHDEAPGTRSDRDLKSGLESLHVGLSACS